MTQQDDEDDEEVESYEDRMLEFARRQTKALEGLHSLAWFWTVAAAIIGLITFLILKGA